MYFVIAIVYNNKYSYNYNYLYTYNSHDLFNFLLNDFKNVNTIKIYTDFTLDIHNNTPLTQLTPLTSLTPLTPLISINENTNHNNTNHNNTIIKHYIDNIQSIILLYSNCIVKNDTIIVTIKNYIAKLKDGSHTHFKFTIINNSIHLEIYVTHIFDNIIKNKSIIYSNNIYVCNKSNIDVVFKSIHYLNSICKLVHCILDKNISCTYLHTYLYNKIISHILS